VIQPPNAPEPLAAAVARAIDAADLGATAPALLLELQSAVGQLTELATAATERGRRPFRPPAGWGERLGAVGLALYSLADQTGVDLDLTIRTRATTLAASASARPAETGWPFQP
jgi:hypothetical protein